MWLQDDLLDELENQQDMESFGTATLLGIGANDLPFIANQAVSAAQEFGPGALANDAAPNMSDMKDLIDREHIQPALAAGTGIYVSYEYRTQKGPRGTTQSGTFSVRGPNKSSSYTVFGNPAKMIYFWFALNFGR